jgi:tryptophanyl-tRNA synthetase
VLVEAPAPLLTPVSRLPGLDNRKMSKSYGNTIDLSDDDAAVTKKIRQMYTDPKRVRADIPALWKAIRSSSTMTPSTPTSPKSRI